MAAPYRSSGMHLIADLYGIDSEKLSDLQAIEDLLKRSAHAAGARIVYSHFHPFGEDYMHVVMSLFKNVFIQANGRSGVDKIGTLPDGDKSCLKWNYMLQIITDEVKP